MNELNDVNGVINSKKNNCFVAELGKEFMFYSAISKFAEEKLKGKLPGIFCRMWQ